MGPSPVTPCRPLLVSRQEGHPGGLPFSLSTLPGQALFFWPVSVQKPTENSILQLHVQERKGDKVSIGSWIYLWAFYSVPLIYMSVFSVPRP